MSEHDIEAIREKYKYADHELLLRVIASQQSKLDAAERVVEVYRDEIRGLLIDSAMREPLACNREQADCIASERIALLHRRSSPSAPASPPAPPQATADEAKREAALAEMVQLSQEMGGYDAPPAPAAPSPPEYVEQVCESCGGGAGTADGSLCHGCGMHVCQSCTDTFGHFKGGPHGKGDPAEYVKGLRTALEFYADPKTYTRLDPKHPGKLFSRPIEYDTTELGRGAIEYAGERARSALASHPPSASTTAAEELHREILALPCITPHYEQAYGAYSRGFDACRNAAAELALRGGEGKADGQ